MDTLTLIYMIGIVFALVVGSLVYQENKQVEGKK